MNLVIPERLTPTHVGNTRPLWSRIWVFWDYPHLRGENPMSRPYKKTANFSVYILQNNHGHGFFLGTFRPLRTLPH